MKKIYNNKNRGFTLLEAMIYTIIFALATMFLLNYDKKIDDEQNNRKIARQINDLTSAIDKRISIEGKNISSWKNGTEWNNDLQFKDLLRKDLIGINNDTCGTPQGWNPTVSLNGLSETSEEGKKLKQLESEAKETKLVPCSMWGVYPYDVHPTAKIVSDVNNEITGFNIEFKFANEADFQKNFRLFSLAFKVAKDQDSNEVLVSKSFFYSNFATKSKINTSECLSIKQNCVLNLNLTLGEEDSKNDKFKVDSSNSFKTNLGFANGKNFDASSDTNNILTCNIWEETSPGQYNANTVECGVTGGNDGYKQVNLIGSTLDTELVQIKGECHIYSSDTTQNGTTTECGMFKNGNIVQITTNQEKAKNLTANIIYTNIFNTNNLSVKNDAVVTQDYSSTGKSAATEVNGLTYPTNQGSSNYNMKLLDPEYLKTIAGISFKTKDLSTISLAVPTAINISNSLLASNSTLKSRLASFEANTVVGGTLNSTNEMEIGSTIAGQYNRQGTLTEGQLNLYNHTLPNNGAILTNNSGSTFVNNNTIVKEAVNINNVKSTVDTNIPVSLYAPITKPELSSTLIAGNVDATNSSITMKNGGVIQTEQLRFANTYNAPNNALTIGKSISFDGLPSYYNISNGIIGGWGSGYYNSNAGIAAKNINITGQLVINSTSPTTIPTFSTPEDGYITSFIGSYTDGITVLQDTADRKGNPWFTINKYGRIFATPYYAVGNTSGFKVGSNGQFFFGYGGIEGQQTLDKPVKSNLTSLVYGYEAEKILPYTTFGYTRTNINNLTMHLKTSAYFGDGAYIYTNGGLPKRMDGTSFVPTQSELPVGYYWETTEPILLRDVHYSATYYLNRSNLIYGFFVEINKKPTIIGQVGERGSIGPSGPTGNKGKTGTQGIPGLVGLRGGE